MQRYKQASEAQVGHKVVLDNVLGIIKELDRTKLVGEVKEVLNDEMVLVAYRVSYQKDPIECATKFFLLQ